uniref:Uncharacterized protein n=1 Tax=Globodera rostochiensis TaxID=31243 RepID=A0A914H6A9_GLORO
MSARFRQAFLRLLNGKKQFINSYKRESLCAQTANGTMTAAARRLRTRRSGSGPSDGSGVLLSRLTAADAETRATLMLRVQRNGNTSCHSIAPRAEEAESQK